MRRRRNHRLEDNNIDIAVPNIDPNLAEQPAAPKKPEGPRQSICLQIYQSKILKALKVQELFVKASTIGLTLFYYHQIEKVPLSERLSSNDYTFLVFMVWQHFHQCLPFDTNPVLDNQRESKLQYCRRLFTTFFTYAIFATTLLATLIVPFASWLDYKFLHVNTDYYAVRYLYYFFYIVITNIRLGAIDNMQMLIADGILLSQITSMLFYNELNLQLVLFCFTPFLLIQNAKICYEVMIFVKEPARKSTFVRLLGSHDSIFIFLMFSVVLCALSFIDALAYDRSHLAFCGYIIFALYAFNRMMDEKKERLAASFLPWTVVFVTVISLGVHLMMQLECSHMFEFAPRTYPLWRETPQEPMYGPKTEAQSIGWFKVRLEGFTAFYNWILYPLWSWIIYPFIRMTIGALLKFIWASLFGGELPEALPEELQEVDVAAQPVMDFQEL